MRSRFDRQRSACSPCVVCRSMCFDLTAPIADDHHRGPRHGSGGGGKPGHLPYRNGGERGIEREAGPLVDRGGHLRRLVEFDWGMDIFVTPVRSSVKRSSLIAGDLPPGVERPILAPISSIMGEILFLALPSDRHQPDRAAHHRRNHAPPPAPLRARGVPGHADRRRRETVPSHPGAVQTAGLWRVPRIRSRKR